MSEKKQVQGVSGYLTPLTVVVAIGLAGVVACGGAFGGGGQDGPVGPDDQILCCYEAWYACDSSGFGDLGDCYPEKCHPICGAEGDTVAQACNSWFAETILTGGCPVPADGADANQLMGCTFLGGSSGILRENSCTQAGWEQDDGYCPQYLAENTGQDGELELHIGGETISPAYHAELGFDIDDCVAQQCTLTMYKMNLGVTGNPGIDGWLIKPAEGTLIASVQTSIDMNTGEFSFPEDSMTLDVWWDQSKDGETFRHSMQTTNSGDSLSGVLDLGAKTVTLSGSFAGDDASIELDDIVAQVNNQPPVAVMGIGDQVECIEDPQNPGKTFVDFNALGSSDPDGNIEHYVWNIDQSYSKDQAVIALALENGTYHVRLDVQDSNDANDEVSKDVTISDTEPPWFPDPVIPMTLGSCLPTKSKVAIPVPNVRDLCDDSTISAVGEVVEVNGEALANPVPILGGIVELPPGSHLVRWSAADGAGHTTSIDQLVVVIHNPSPEACCDTSMGQFVGDDNNDFLFKNAQETTPWCVFSYGGDDDIIVGQGADFVSLGPDSDFVFTRGGADTVLGGDGDDFLTSADDDDLIYGQDGDDSILSGAGDDTIIGGLGSDFIMGMGGDDVLIPGDGADIVLGGPGDDTIYVYDACELGAGDFISGGFGNDTLYLPMSQEDAQAMGVIITGTVEQVLLLPPEEAIHRECE